MNKKTQMPKWHQYEMALMAGAQHEKKDWVTLNTPPRDRTRCRICGRKARMEFDHKAPKSRGGLGMRPICWRCNRIKSDRRIGDANLKHLVRQHDRYLALKMDGKEGLF